MTNTANKVLQIGLWIILAISVVLFVFFYVKGEDMTETVLNWGFVLLAVTVALLIIFPITYFIKNPKAGLKFLIMVVLFGVLFGIGYSLASDATNAVVYEKNEITPAISRLIGGGLFTLYILAGLAVLTLIVAGIRGAFK